MLSLFKGLDERDEAAWVIEADVAFSEAAVLALRAQGNPDHSIWTACGFFAPEQIGGILRADEQRNILDIRYAPYSPELRNFYKNLGAIFISAEAMPLYRELLRKQAEKNLDCYFMTVWAENLSRLPALLLDLGADGAVSFNTPEEYARAQRRLLESSEGATAKSIEYMEVARLRHIEDFDPSRVTWLAEKIAEERIWTLPLVVDTEGLVMDGQHRFEAAKLLKLHKVPVVCFDYNEVEIWSLRPDTHAVSLPLLRNMVASGKTYPEKTVKHKFPTIIPACAIPLETLMTPMHKKD